ncbi:ABC transporter ATP-binding protein [Alcaligenes sp. 13f]|uniref:dipeptide ABC transporter ATP-binding protein n=1 Tax=Alcaligenes sp. 13f TaxID=2841924 RepID=UPI001CF664A6|nr:ABC transporter ATP-binding protein [Alcaligenes sp. 13f]MCB4324052.1 ABC transporter ATP-binding protein [Alcaligenes sp. 13f]
MNTSTTKPHCVLSVKDLCIETKAAQPRQLVNKLSFDVYAGETLCIVGESGSGKSLSSFAIMGLLPPDTLRVSQGSIELMGQNLLTMDKEHLLSLRASAMSMVFQEPMTALNPVQRVGEQIDEVIRIHEKNSSRQERRQRVINMLERVRLPEPEKLFMAYPHELSGGQRQRIMIAMALILQPRLLIADEPTTALDVTTQKQILSLIKELQSECGTSVIFVTHDFGVVADIADRILVMKRGDSVEMGTCQQILSSPKEAYTRSLIASVPNVHPPAKEEVQNEVVLSARGLGKVYGSDCWFSKGRKMHALSDINLDIRRDEVLGVVGESGSGKSTLARCIIGLVEASSGQITLNGETLPAACKDRSLAQRRKVQIVFQDPYRSLNPRVTIGQSLTEGMHNIGVDPKVAIERVTEVLSIVGLDADVLERYPHQFSGGQRQRLCLARAIVMEPDVLIADESVSALDVLVQEQVLKLLVDIKRKTGVAILFITHDLRVAAQISDRIVVMQKGRIVEAGDPGRVISQPSQAYTRELVESAPGVHWDFQNFCAYA